ncbi:MarR family transcriptional regulator [Nocardia sp. SYP-A9097]|uniref:MarR family winged helix-turn-helix transcriptional regulator n=1 Tax=Nocardia sp. SYP-A9097 TaxID=2663237 RepID=UPI00129B4AC0|nr:MarR family transcriptional regulator [Nocardia sp. SYP-A9097]MRH90109.1 MarR family transcriptional regulator [Nocardia sp. SYP-A9097]
MEPLATPPIDRRTSLGYLINHLARLMEHALRDRIAEYGVVSGQFAQLLALYEQDGVPQHELCEKVRIDQSTMAHTLKRMERDGLIQRTADPADGRRALIHLTERAQRLRAALVSVAHEVNDIAAAGFSGPREEDFLRMARQAIGNLEADRAHLNGKER